MQLMGDCSNSDSSQHSAHQLSLPPWPLFQSRDKTWHIGSACYSFYLTALDWNPSASLLTARCLCLSQRARLLSRVRARVSCCSATPSSDPEPAFPSPISSFLSSLVRRQNVPPFRRH